MYDWYFIEILIIPACKVEWGFSLSKRRRGWNGTPANEGLSKLVPGTKGDLGPTRKVPETRGLGSPKPVRTYSRIPSPPVSQLTWFYLFSISLKSSSGVSKFDKSGLDFHDLAMAKLFMLQGFGYLYLVISKYLWLLSTTRIYFYDYRKQSVQFKKGQVHTRERKKKK